MANSVQQYSLVPVIPGSADIPAGSDSKGKVVVPERDFLDKCADPKKHVIHTLLFILCAGLTFAYWGSSHRSVDGVLLTDFKKLGSSDVVSKEIITKYDALLTKWKCTAPVPNSTDVSIVEPWGPDSMCRCIRLKTCDGENCKKVEEKCLDTHVPEYAYVFAGYDSSYYNIIIAFFFLHIAAMMNMYVETAEDRSRDESEDEHPQHGIEHGASQDGGSGTKVVDLVKGNGILKPNTNDTPPNTPLPQTPQNKAHHNHKNGGNNGVFNPQNPHEPQSRKRNHENFQVIPEHDPRYRSQKPTIFGDGGSIFPNRQKSRTFMQLSGYMYLGVNGAGNNHPDVSTYQDEEFSLNFLRNEKVRLFLIWTLSVISLGVSIKSIMSKNDLGQKDTSQTCPSDGCITQNLLTVITISLSSFTVALLSINFIAILTGGKPMHIPILSMTIWEDIYNTAAFMLLVASFSTMSGVHDDTTVLFDVLVVVFIGFIQTIQHIIMLKREDLISYCRDVGLTIYDTFGRSHTVEVTILSYFLYTRLFLFSVIAITVFVFVQRIEPSISSSGFSESWNYHMRNATLLLSLTPSIISDISYELNHIIGMRSHGEYSPYVGAHVWRRGVFLWSIIMYCVISFKSLQLDPSATGI